MEKEKDAREVGEGRRELGKHGPGLPMPVLREGVNSRQDNGQGKTDEGRPMRVNINKNKCTISISSNATHCNAPQHSNGYAEGSRAQVRGLFIWCQHGQWRKLVTAYRP